MRNLLITFFIFISAVILAQDKLPSPDQFLPTNYGKEFTPHHLIVDYFQYIAEQSDQVLFQPYGYSTEKRKLGIAIISSPSNIKNIEKIRLNNLKLTGLVKGKPKMDIAKAIVWINFGVHGNEAGSTETSLNLLYQLAQKDAKWLDNVVIIINPSVNPDGFDRYVTWNRSVSNQTPMPNVLSREHHEPWPTGRTNHYYFDLNRDWSWATQKETKQLLKIYHSWMPHVVPDMHEQNANSSYYFAPATQPYHEYISRFQGKFQSIIGQENAKAFDKEGWLYYTKETFDLLYPGYGDTYPMFNGAIGMTYEQAGHGIAGNHFLLDTGDTLTIQDRINHHTTASISTIKTTSLHRSKLVKAFKKYFDESQKGNSNTYQAFIIKKGDKPHRLQKLTTLLDRHFIQYYTVKKSLKAEGYDYQLRQNATFQYKNGDLVIPTAQPMGVLTKVLFEPTTHIEDSLTYDVTAWALPYAFGLQAFATKEQPPALSAFAKKSPNQKVQSTNNYAWIIEWTGVSNAACLTELLQKNINVRFANRPFSLSGKTFGRGSFVVTQEDNQKRKSNLAKIIADAAHNNSVHIHGMTTGLTHTGPDLGSKSMKLIQKPKIALVYGDQIDPYQYGEFWHYLDAELQQPFTAIPIKSIGTSSIWDFNTIILVSGNYKSLKSKEKKYLLSWTKGGGQLILVGSACNVFTGKQSLQQAINTEDLPEYDDQFMKYAKIERHNADSGVPGGIVEVLIDNTHPLGFGYPEQIFSLKDDHLSYALLNNGHNIGRTANSPKTIGFFGKHFLAHLGDNMIFGHRPLGEGQIIYFVNSPLFRGFWEDGKLMVANALFFRP